MNQLPFETVNSQRRLHPMWKNAADKGIRSARESLTDNQPIDLDGVCEICGEQESIHDPLAEMYDPEKPDKAWMVHAQCGLWANMEIA